MFAELLEDCMGLTDAELDDRVRDNELRLRRLQAEQAAALSVSMARGAFRIDGQRTINSYLRATCNLSNGTATEWRKVSEACDLVPELGDALTCGRIGVDQVVEIARIHANPRTKQFFTRVAPIYVEYAEHDSYTELKGRIDDFLTLVDEDGSFAETLCDIEERVAHVGVVGGTLDVKVRGGDPIVADEFVAIFDLFAEEEFRADVEARRAEHGDRADEHPLGRSDRQRRFDAMIAMARHARAHLAEGKPAGAAEVVTNIVADLPTWWETFESAGIVTNEHGSTVELDDDTIDDVIAGAAQDPAAWIDRQCHTADGTPIPTTVLLAASLTGLVRRVVVDSAGVVIDRGRAARLFEGEARAAAKLLMRECSHPGCSVKVRAADVDHMIEWWAGGRTDQTNADIRCSTHNRAKHRERWSTERDPNGRRFTIRPDGSIMLPAGARPPRLPIGIIARHLARQLEHHFEQRRTNPRLAA